MFISVRKPFKQPYITDQTTLFIINPETFMNHNILAFGEKYETYCTEKIQIPKNKIVKDIYDPAFHHW